jgi:hypothetical protein
MADFGVEAEKREELVRRYTTPAMQRFYDLMLEQVDKRDFLSATLALNVILEGMAYPIYRYEKAYWSRIDPGLSDIINAAFLDEVAHVGYGEAYLRAQAREPAVRNKLTKLAGEFHTLMMEIFNTVIHRYVGLYQAAANAHMETMGDVEIFPDRKMRELTEEDQIRTLMASISHEYERRMRNIGLDLKA